MEIIGLSIERRLPQENERGGKVMMKKTLSVVIPTHNREELLREVLQALSRQTYPLESFEVVVVVDGSDDGTMEMLSSIEVPYKLSSIWQKQSGVARARNIGAEHAVGELILFLDDDVIPDPTLLYEHVRCHCDNDNSVVIGRVSPAVKAKRPGWSKWEEQLLERHFKTLAEKRKEVVGRHLYSGNFSVTRKHFLRVGGFDETMTRAEDVDLGLRLEQIGLRFRFNPKADGIHCGYRSYDAWRKIPYQYGRLDVIMGRDKRYPNLSKDTFSAFHARNLFTRQSVKICLGRKHALNLTLGTLRSLAFCGDLLGLSHLTRYLYSGIANLLYWQGASDELGGTTLFWQEINRHHPTVSQGSHSAARASSQP